MPLMSGEVLKIDDIYVPVKRRASLNEDTVNLIADFSELPPLFNTAFKFINT